MPSAELLWRCTPYSVTPSVADNAPGRPRRGAEAQCRCPLGGYDKVFCGRVQNRARPGALVLGGLLRGGY